MGCRTQGKDTLLLKGRPLGKVAEWVAGPRERIPSFSKFYSQTGSYDY